MQVLNEEHRTTHDDVTPVHSPGYAQLLVEKRYGTLANQGEPCPVNWESMLTELLEEIEFGLVESEALSHGRIGADITALTACSDPSLVWPSTL
jgi:hypothetical protein